VFETPREDWELALYRDRRDGELPTILLVAPVSEHPVPGILERLQHECALRDELDSEWVARPLTLARREGRTTLVLEDPGGDPVDRLMGQPMELSWFLPLRCRPGSCGGQTPPTRSYPQGYQAANILVNSATGAAWLTGFGTASRLPRERQSPEPPEVIGGTLAHMAPEQTGRMNRSIDSRREGETSDKSNRGIGSTL
jgi:hypothetical protein